MLFRLASVAGSMRSFSGAGAGFCPHHPSLKFAARSLNFLSDYSDARLGSIGQIRAISMQRVREKHEVPG
jgi:hypothetical protein